MATIEHTGSEITETDTTGAPAALPAGGAPAHEAHEHADAGGHGGAALTNPKLAMWLFLAAYGWAMEPSVAPDSDFDPVPPDDGPGSELATVGSEA